jgi:hypothetical protein
MIPAMRVIQDNFWAPKRGSPAEEYEDAFAPARGGEFAGERLRFAVADGATEAVFSKLWARLLVAAYRKGWIGGRTPATRDGLERLGRLWQHRISGKPLPWYAEEKVRSGSFAALCGLELSASEDGAVAPGGPGAPSTTGTWRCWSVGDCCLFHVRGERLLGSFPIESPEDFGSRPVLLSTKMDRNGAALASAGSAWGDWAAGDAFYLMSDAIACWFLTEHTSGRAPWPEARELGAESFPGWVSGLREERGLRNDDVTLVRIALV